MFTLSTSCARNSTTCGGEKSLMSSEEKVSSSATLAYGKLESLQAIGQLWLTHGRFAPTYARNFHELRPGQTGNVWLPNIFKHCLVIKHFTVWTPCLMMFDGVSSCLNSINHSIKQHQTFLLSSSFSSFGQVHQTFLACACEMHYRRFRHVEIVVVFWVILRPTTPCVRMFDYVW